MNVTGARAARWASKAERLTSYANELGDSITTVSSVNDSGSTRSKGKRWSQ